MKLEGPSLSRLAVPLRALVDRFAFGALIVLSVGLLIVGKADQRLFEAIDTTAADLLSPLVAVVTEPIAASRRLAETIGEVVAVHQENTRLRGQNRRLLEWQAVAGHLERENAALRQVLHLESHAGPPTAVTARVVADAGGPFVHTVLVAAGSDQGVTLEMAAINEHGLVGRVIEVGRRSARVLLLTDFNSRIPVMVEPSRDQAILLGDNTLTPRLDFLPINPHAEVDNRVVTSGRGGVLPPGLMVGVISALDEHGPVVTPLVDWDRLEYLRLLDHAPVLPPETLEVLQQEVHGPPLPPGFVPPERALSPPAEALPAGEAPGVVEGRGAVPDARSVVRP